MLSSKLGVRAWVVSDRDNEYAEVVYAESRGKAKARGMTEHDFTDRVVRRAPEFDEYLTSGGPTKETMLAHGWYFECDECYGHVTQETGGVKDGRVLCTFHLADVGGADVEAIRTRLLPLLDAVLPTECGQWTATDYMFAPEDGRTAVLAALENEFAITIPPDDVTEALGNTVSHLAGYIGLRQLATKE